MILQEVYGKVEGGHSGGEENIRKSTKSFLLEEDEKKNV